MSVNEQNLGGDLYSNLRKEQKLSPSAELEFTEYLEQLEKLSKLIRDNNGDTSPWRTWENGLRQFYKQMIYDAFEKLAITMPPGMEVHFAGSLAKAQATEYSDLDALVIVKHEDDVAKVKPVFDAINNLCERIFYERQQLWPDMAGINPGLLTGTPEQLYHLLKGNEGQMLSVEKMPRTILASRPIFPNYELGEELHRKIKEDPALSQFCSAEKFYNAAIEEFAAPEQNAEEIHIKDHIMRPIDFILMGLREEFDLYSEDGAHLSAPGTIRLLREQKLLPEKDIARIESVYNQAMNKRFKLHAEHEKEHDKMPRTEAEEMLEDIEKIRQLGVQRITRIRDLENAKELWQNANNMLEKGNVSRYLEAAYVLNQFMKHKNFNADDLRPKLSDKTISPNVFAVFEEIWAEASGYNKTDATSIDAIVETSLISAVNKMSAFFVDCKLNPKERAITSDPDFKLPKSKVLDALVRFIETFDLYSNDGAHLSAPRTIHLLRKKELLPEEDISRIESVYNQAMTKRYHLHAEHEKEHDEMPRVEAEDMLEEIEKIRQLSAQHITRTRDVGNAKELWENANDMLEKGNVSGYLEAAHELNQFMKDKNLKEDDLRPELSEKIISPKGFAILAEIWRAASVYSRAAATLEDNTVESSFVSAVNKMSSFFMDCKLKPNECATTPDLDFNILNSKVLVAIMRFISDVAEPTSKICMHSTRVLMRHKIATIEKLKNVNDAILESVLGSKGEHLSEFLFYKHATTDKGRDHKCTVSTKNFRNIKNQYKEMRGDALKTAVLIDFKYALAEASDKLSLAKIVSELKNKDEYKILATGQGLPGQKISAVIAFEDMVKEAKKDIKSRQHVSKI